MQNLQKWKSAKRPIHENPQRRDLWLYREKWSGKDDADPSDLWTAGADIRGVYIIRQEAFGPGYFKVAQKDGGGGGDAIHLSGYDGRG